MKDLMAERERERQTLTNRQRTFKIRYELYLHREMIDEAFPTRRSFQEVINLPLKCVLHALFVIFRVPKWPPQWGWCLFWTWSRKLCRKLYVGKNDLFSDITKGIFKWIWLKFKANTILIGSVGISNQN